VLVAVVLTDVGTMSVDELGRARTRVGAAAPVDVPAMMNGGGAYVEVTGALLGEYNETTKRSRSSAVDPEFVRVTTCEPPLRPSNLY
jgi:hypothetical protein